MTYIKFQAMSVDLTASGSWVMNFVTRPIISTSKVTLKHNWVRTLSPSMRSEISFLQATRAIIVVSFAD